MRKDGIVEAVIFDLRERSNKGIAQYGMTLEENNSDDFLQHLYEELLDSCLYIKKLQSLRDKLQ